MCIKSLRRPFVHGDRQNKKTRVATFKDKDEKKFSQFDDKNNTDEGQPIYY